MFFALSLWFVRHSLQHGAHLYVVLLILFSGYDRDREEKFYGRVSTVTVSLYVLPFTAVIIVYRSCKMPSCQRNLIQWLLAR